MRMPWEPKPPDVRCPSCSSTETMFVKWAEAWTVGTLQSHTVGACVVCLRCDQPYVVTPAGPFTKRKPSPAMQIPIRSTPEDRIAPLQAAVNALDDEPI